MTSIDELVTSALESEAQNAPPPHAVMRRVLAETTGRRRRITPLAMRLTAAAVTAALVAAGILTATRWDPAPPADQTPSTPTEGALSYGPGRLPGYVDVSWGTLHLEVAVPQRRQSETLASLERGCTKSVLSPDQPGRAACLDFNEGVPTAEIAIGPGAGGFPRDADRVRWLRPMRIGFVDKFGIAGYAAEQRLRKARVGYDCEPSCRSWKVRMVSVVYFPTEDLHVTIVAPRYTIVWMLELVYFD